MSAVLALTTCGPQLEVALRATPDAVASIVRLAGVSPRSTLLLAAIDLLFEDAGSLPSDLERVVVSRGPGSFTGIRAGIATAEGLESAVGCSVSCYDSLTVQAARCHQRGVVWTAQPGRRGEVYARPFRVAPEQPPVAVQPIEILPIDRLWELGPWIAPERLDLGGAERLVASRAAAEALLELLRLGVPSDPVEPLFVEGPPIHGEAGRG
jgi:tRNA threonylcarbamoyladenosine biosynthesis protein TsaB